jgi:NDP-sugar pyrophosphorylase family protein
MHIIVPMSGIGKRFIEAGYPDPKPLIVVDGKPIIQHVVEMFPGESKFSFICNSDHLRNTRMRSILERIAPSGTIHEVAPHKKGPVHAVSQICHQIDDGEEVVVNYCDFGKKWDYQRFLSTTRAQGSDGALSAYRGFHPHMLHSPNYAYMREANGQMLEIQEKMSEYASDGTYYFRTGAILKRFFDETVRKDVNVNGEYYVSVVYNLLVQAGLKVSIFEIEKMFQWGTPQDLAEYVEWGRMFQARRKAKPQLRIPDSLLLIPMAGRGSRFAAEGYTTPKPLIEVDGQPMIVNAAEAMPCCQRQVFVALSEHLAAHPIESSLRKAFPECRILGIDGVTEGQAITCLMGVEDEDPEQKLFIAASDNSMLYNPDELRRLIESGADVVVFGFLGGATASRNPKMYGWIRTNGEDVVEVSVKQPISEDPAHDRAVVGAFYFRTVEIFRKAVESLVAHDVRVNGEFYADSLVNEVLRAGGTAKMMPVDHYICWGTPNDLRSFQYWEEHFDRG